MRLNSKFFISLLFFFSFLTLESYSQNYLELKKATQLKSINFFEGENIRFKQKDDAIFTYARLTGIGSDYLSFNNVQIPISNIDIVDIRSKTSNKGRAYGSLISGGSLGYFAIDFINLSIVQKANYKDVFNEDILVSCSIGFSIGLIIRTFAKKKLFKRKNLNRIWIKELL
jgi:hypothetical protein|tara:strand:- start:1387 stop:1899 length:513 start_codon:yes stop_codon:yes gene_type:complete